MNYDLIKNTIDLVKEFESSNTSHQFPNDILGLQQWLFHKYANSIEEVRPSWEGQENGRSAESVISTQLIHMNRYAKMYSKSAMHGSKFSTQDEFIFLIVLRTFGPMSKMDLIKRNIQEKPAGMKLIDRLIANDWVKQVNSKIDKRSKLISISPNGIETLDAQMEKIRQATTIVTGNLTESEKMQLILLLSKLEDFHQVIYNQNINPTELLNSVINDNKES